MAARPALHPSPGESSLLVCPPFEDAQAHGCLDLVLCDGPDETRLFGVTLEQSIEKRLAVWNREVGAPPAAATIATVDTGWELSTASETAEAEAGHDTLSVEMLSSPSDLEGVAALAESTLQEWAGTSEQIAICIRSLTTLLQYAERSMVASLLDDLNGLAREHDAVAHYHLNRDAHDRETIQALASVCDTVYEYDGTGWRSGPSAASPAGLRSR